MGNDRTPVMVAVGLVAVVVGLVSQDMAWTLALRVVVALVSLVSLGVLCWELARWADEDE